MGTFGAFANLGGNVSFFKAQPVMVQEPSETRPSPALWTLRCTMGLLVRRWWRCRSLRLAASPCGPFPFKLLWRGSSILRQHTVCQMATASGCRGNMREPEDQGGKVPLESTKAAENDTHRSLKQDHLGFACQHPTLPVRFVSLFFVPRAGGATRPGVGVVTARAHSAFSV